MNPLSRLIYKIESKILLLFFYQKHIRAFSHSILNFLVRHTKPDVNLVLFGAMNGKWYGDNSYHLYEWCLTHRKDIRPVWMTRNLRVFNMLKENNKPVVLSPTIGGLRCLLKARVGVYTNSLKDLAMHPFATHNKLNVIALRHGRSVKRVRFARKGHKMSAIEEKERSLESHLIKYAISTSEMISELQEECLLIGPEKHIVTGYPRNDHLFNVPIYDKETWDEFLGSYIPKKVVLYGPSWRHGRTPTKFFPFSDFEKSQLYDFLESHQILLLLRPHVGELSNPTVRNFLIELAENCKFIRFASHEVFPDINTILPFMDALISDYSALYHDFLLLNRPLMFVPYDYDDFNKQNGFLYDYFENLPGPAIDSFADFLSNLESIHQGLDPYKDRRNALTELVHTNNDGKSSERVAALIDKARQAST